MTLDRFKTPGKNFALGGWKLTLPSGDEVSTQMLVDGYEKSGVFYTDQQNGAMVFECPNVAGTTPHSHYSRCELRELPSWRAINGGTLSARCSVDRVSTTGDIDKIGRVVIGQIHGPISEVVRLYFEKKPGDPLGRIYAAMDDADDKPLESKDIARFIALGRKFSYTIRLLGRSLRIAVRTSPDELNTFSAKIDSRYLGADLYFKAGVYNQQNTGTPDDGVKATFVALRHEHP